MAEAASWWPAPADRSSSSATAPATPLRACSSSPSGWAHRCSPRSRRRASSATTTRSAPGCSAASGTPVASWLMNESDLVIALGASFSNHTGIADYKPIVQVDDDPAALGRFHPVTCRGARRRRADPRGPVRCAARTRSSRADQRGDVAARWELWRDEKRRRLDDDRGAGVASVAVFDALSRICPHDAVICVDVGNNTYSFGRYFESSGAQSVLMSGYLGSIGFGLPAALGAWAAAPDRPIVVVSGDGGFGQYLAELTTAVKYHIPIRHVLLDNSALGKITKEQRAAELDVWQTALRQPRLRRLRRAVRRGRHPGRRRRPARRRPRAGVRHRRARAGARRRRRRARLSHVRPRRRQRSLDQCCGRSTRMQGRCGCSTWCTASRRRSSASSSSSRSSSGATTAMDE